MPFLDIHSHLLPGIDDGCVDFDESLQCIRLLIERGFAGSVCTSHMCVRELPHVTPDLVARKAAQLREEIKRAGLAYRIWTGGEVRLDAGTVPWFEKHGVPALGEGQCVLVDIWEDWQPYADEAIEYLQQRGYQPILAHPERMPISERRWLELLDGLEGRGVWLQGNLKPIGGRDAQGSQERAFRLLDADRYRLVAVDMHRPNDLTERLDGIEVLAARVGSERLQRLLGDEPERAIGLAGRAS